MFFHRYRRFVADERGQAMVIGACTLLVMAIAVLSSIAIGNGVYEKIKLQDAADAHAYSMAAKEARAYNFFAYTNRAMIVHYAAMMTFMAYVSHAFYLDKTIGALAGVIGKLKDTGIPIVSQIGLAFYAIQQIIKYWKIACDVIAWAMLPLLTGVNIAMWVAQEAMLLAVETELLAGGDLTPLTGTDPKASRDFAASGGVQGVLQDAQSILLHTSNAYDFLLPLDDGQHSNESLPNTGTLQRAKLLQDTNKLSDPDMAKYRLLMGNLANGARRAWTANGDVNPQIPLIGRKWSIHFFVLVLYLDCDKLADTAIRNYSEVAGSSADKDDGSKPWDDPDSAGGSALSGLISGATGSLSLPSVPSSGGGGSSGTSHNLKDQIYSYDGIEMSAGVGIKVCVPYTDLCYAQKLAPFFDFKFTFAVAADNKSGFHDCFYDGGKKGRHHAWLGITPFIHSDPSFFNPWSYHFSWPCPISVVTRDMISSTRVYEMNMTYMKESGTSAGTGVLDMTWNNVFGNDTLAGFNIGKVFRDRSKGMTAWAVGRALYHHPGNWKEEPNFFNALWTPRLAPVMTHYNDKVFTGTFNLALPEVNMFQAMWNVAKKANSNAPRMINY